MGGSAFPNHHVPRMSHAQHDAIREKCTWILLQTFYTHVVSPPEAPDKADHGDVDLLVSDPQRSFNVDELMAELGALARTKATGSLTSFLVPLESTAEDDRNRSDNDESNHIYAQIDIHVVNPDFLAWEYFMQSYGDMMQIIGRLQRPLGLTANDRGFHVRIAEMEVLNRKAAMVFLTRDPNVMMNFLGLDTDAFARGFSSNEELFHWIAQGRFFETHVLRRDVQGHEGNKDRIHYRKRAMFTDFLTRWAETHLDVFVSNKRDWSRDEVLTEVLQWFGDEARIEYTKKRAEHNSKSSLSDHVKQITQIDGGQRLGWIMKGLQRWVAFEDDRPVLKDSETGTEEDIQSKWAHAVMKEHNDAAIKFVAEHWEEILRREEERNNTMLTGRAR